MNKFPELTTLDQKNVIAGPYGENGNLDFDESDINDESDIKDIFPRASKQENTIEQGGHQNKNEGTKVKTKNLLAKTEPELIKEVKILGRELLSLIGTKNKQKTPPKKKILNSSSNMNIRATPKGEKTNEDPKSEMLRSVERLHSSSKRTKEKIATLQFLKYQAEISQLKQKPEINNYSKSIVNERNISPIHLRVDKMVAQRRRNYEILREESQRTQREKEMQHCTFQPEILTKSSTQSEFRTVREFTNQHYAWQVRKQETIEKEKYKVLAKEMEGVTFKPKIDRNSSKIFEQNQGSQSVFQRFETCSEKTQAKKKQILEKNLPPFRPQLGSKRYAISPSKSPMQKNTVSHQKTKTSYISTMHSTEANSIFDKEPEIKQTKLISARSFLDLSQHGDRVPNLFDGSTPVRSVTPNEPKRQKPRSAKIQEINYTPTMEFLVKKVKKGNR